MSLNSNHNHRKERKEEPDIYYDVNGRLFWHTKERTHVSYQLREEPQDGKNDWANHSD